MSAVISMVGCSGPTTSVRRGGSSRKHEQKKSATEAKTVCSVSSCMRETSLYHVTHRRLVKRIVKQGLDPQKSRFRKKRVWLCEKWRLAWAGKHIADSHKWKATELCILVVTVPTSALKQCGRKGVFFVDCVLKGVAEV